MKDPPKPSRNSTNRRWTERLLDIASGSTVFSWGVVAVVREHRPQGFSVPFLSILLLNLCVVFLFLRRERPRKVASAAELIACLPSVVMGPISFARADALSIWPTGCTLLFAGGTGFTIWSLLSLGKSFAIFPATRSLSTAGPYRTLRHPAYLGQVLMATAAATTNLDTVGIFIIAATVAATVVRIHIEERALRRSCVEYAEYQRHVPWRLVPWLW